MDSDDIWRRYSTGQKFDLYCISITLKMNFNNLTFYEATSLSHISNTKYPLS